MNVGPEEMNPETTALDDGAWLLGRATSVTRWYGAPKDNVAPRPAIRPRGTSQQGPWRTTCEVTINSVTVNWRKDRWHRNSLRWTPEPKWHAARREHSAVTPSSSEARPEDSHRLKARLNVIRVKPVKPDVPCLNRGRIC